MSHPCLARIRLAHVERCQEAYERLNQHRHGEPSGLPDALVDAGCWLVAHGWDGEASAAEEALGWGPARYRSFLAGAGTQVASQCIEDGRKTLFEGRNPIFPEPRLARAA